MAKIVHLLADDLGYGDLACYGSTWLVTPNIDALAAAGRKFTRFYTAHPVCSPSRCAWITGRLPQYSGIWWADDPNSDFIYWLPPGTATVATILREALGYSTAHFGKWHLGAARDAGLPTDFGFQRWFGHLGGWAGFTDYTNRYQMDQEPPAAATSGHVTNTEADKAIEWLDAHWDEDFYMQFWCADPHEPTIELEPEVATHYSSRTTREKKYGGHITRLDAQVVGRIIAKLDEKGVLGQTYIIFSSDNGPEPQDGSHPGSAGSTGGLRGHKTSLGEGGIRVPCIIRGPGISAGSTDAGVRSALDWLPTVLAIAGLPATSALSGSSLLSAVPSGRILYWEADERGINGGRIHGEDLGFFAAQRDDGWKLMRFASGGSDDRLYDLNTDPGETTDVGGANPTIKTALVDALTTFIASLPNETAAHDIDRGNVGSESAANAYFEAGNPRRAVWFYLTPGTGGEIDTTIANMNKLLGLPRTAPCSHGFSGVSETAYSGGQVTHPTLGGQTIRVNSNVIALLADPTNRARCSASELADLDDRFRYRTGLPVV